MPRLSTRLLLTSAAIAVAGGALFTVNAYVGGTLTAVAPLLYGATIGIYFVPGALAQALFRRGGIALLTSTLAGLVSAPFQPIGFWAVLIGVGIGLLQELPVLISRYRYWAPWTIYMGALFAGTVLSGAVFRVTAGEQLQPIAAVIQASMYVLSPVIFTVVARVFARALDQTGVARGLQLSVDRRSQA